MNELITLHIKYKIINFIIILNMTSSSSSNSNQQQPSVIYLRDDAASRYDLSVQSPQHPMKPWRLLGVHGVVRRLGLFDVDESIMKVMTPPSMPAELMKDFHLPEYVNDLEKASGDCWRFAPIDESGSSTAAATSSTNNNNNTSSNLLVAPQQDSATATSNQNTTTTNNSNNNNNNINNGQSSNQTQGPQAQTSSSTGNVTSNNNNTLERAPSCFSPFDCPVVQGGLEYSRIVAGSSLFGATLLNANATRIVVNWCGGMHHARAGTCSGFCYVNDCVIAIRELLRAHDRVLYIDLDVHHGDGVEEAFYDSDRVFTLSLHKFADGFFPGTGHPSDIGVDAGRYYNMNVPLRDGVRDNEYVELFMTAFNGIIKNFKPQAIVCQCGADSLAGDRVGGTCMRLSSAGHGACVRAVRDSGLKVLALGGGGYAVRNVARLWAYETAILCGCDKDIHQTHEMDSSLSPCRPRIHSRSMFSLPDPASVLNFFPATTTSTTTMRISTSEEQEENNYQMTMSLRNLLKDVIGSSSTKEIQLKLEERALLMIFPEFALMNSSYDDGNSEDAAIMKERRRQRNENINGEDSSSSSSSSQQHFVSLFISSDDGGFEVRQNYSALNSGGVGAVVMQRFVQTTLKRIVEHLNYVRK